LTAIILLIISIAQIHNYYDLDVAVILNFNTASTTRGNISQQFTCHYNLSQPCSESCGVSMAAMLRVMSCLYGSHAHSHVMSVWQPCSQSCGVSMTAMLRGMSRLYSSHAQSHVVSIWQRCSQSCHVCMTAMLRGICCLYGSHAHSRHVCIAAMLRGMWCPYGSHAHSHLTSV